jgi:hypothetical protein
LSKSINFIGHPSIKFDRASAFSASGGLKFRL